MLTADGQLSVGRISKQWSGLAKEYFTDADNFGIQCKPLHFDVFSFHTRNSTLEGATKLESGV